MSDTRKLNTKRKRVPERSTQWGQFRRACGALAEARHAGAFAADEQPALSATNEPCSDLVAEFQVQQEVQRRLAVEYALTLGACQRLQSDINRRAAASWGDPCAELDGRLEREVLELAVCEEAYELVSEELDLVRRELERRGLARH
jgi:hypothetical protein